MPYKDKERRNEWQRNNAASRKLRGLCVIIGCESKPVQGDTQCVQHLYLRRARGIRYYRRHTQRNPDAAANKRLTRLKEGRCYECGCPLIPDESKYCMACRAGWHTNQIKGVLEYAVTD